MGIARSLWRQGRKITGVFREPHVQIKGVKTKRFGNDYGGFDVAMDRFSKDAQLVVYSFGIGEDLSFSADILQYYKCANIYAFDPTPKAITYVHNNELMKNPRFQFFPYGVATSDEKMKFHLPQNENYVSGSLVYHEELREDSISVEMKRVSTLMKELGHSHVDILKMDIEGSEFDVIEDIVHGGGNFEQLCVEIHSRFYKDGAKRLRTLKETLNANGYYAVSVSPSKEEVTFCKIKD